MKAPVLRLLFTVVFVAAAFAPLPTFGRSGWWQHAGLKPRSVPQPLFPERMLMAGVQTGTVRVMLEVAPDGRPADYLITAYTARPFADAVRDAVERWRFEPTEVGHVIDLTLRFETRGMVAIVKQFEPEGPRWANFAYQPCSPRELDRPPRPVSLVEPAYNEQLKAAGTAGLVTIEYFIDETGRVRVPVAAAATADPLLAGLAIAAVRQWRFEPPTCDGEPTIVRAQQSFRFGGETPGHTPPAKG